MSDNPDRPFDHNTLKMRAVFVPEGAEGQFSQADITGEVGSDSVQVPAVFVPEGGTPPSPPYEHFGEAHFRPDQQAGPQQITTSWQSSAPQDRAPQPEQESDPPTPPPTPALALARRQGGTSLATGLAAWRSAADPGSVWRQSQAMPRSSPAAQPSNSSSMPPVHTLEDAGSRAMPRRIRSAENQDADNREED